MTCRRCQGFMYDGFLAEANGIYVVKKCANCGEVLDEVILSNRARPQAARVRRRPLWRKSGLRLVAGAKKT